jgi:transposase
LFARPRTPNDNPYIESAFSTVKRAPEYPGRFLDDDQAVAYFNRYFTWHDTEHYHSAKRFVRQLEQAYPLPFRRMESEPGQEAQVDFGQGAWVVEDGRRCRPHVLRVVLSHSRKGYTEAFWRQTTENFVRGLENAFRHFGGVVRTLVIDNLRAAVNAKALGKRVIAALVRLQDQRVRVIGNDLS